MHVIRIRGFWEIRTDTADRKRHVRRFGRPRTLDPQETIWLAGESLPGPADIFVNEVFIGGVRESGRAFAFEITAQLDVRNTLAIMTGTDAAMPEVRLEIRERRSSSSVPSSGSGTREQA